MKQGGLGEGAVSKGLADTRTRVCGKLPCGGFLLLVLTLGPPRLMAPQAVLASQPACHRETLSQRTRWMVDHTHTPMHAPYARMHLRTHTMKARLPLMSGEDYIVLSYLFVFF